MVAALIVGVALIMRVETDFKLFGYPGLAIIFFIIAATFGIVLVFNILFTDEKKQESDSGSG